MNLNRKRIIRRKMIHCHKLMLSNKHSEANDIITSLKKYKKSDIKNIAYKMSQDESKSTVLRLWLNLVSISGEL